MGVLNRKLARDVLGSAAALTTVVAIIAVGTGTFIGMGSAYRILRASQKSYYRHYRFADFWIDVKKAPLSAVRRVAELPGVADLEARVVFDVILDLPGVIEPIRGRVISTPARRFDKTLNGICLVSGSGFSDDRDEEIILGDQFAKAHGLKPGDRVSAILNRRKQSYVVVGTAISPEYVYMVSGAGSVVPDPQHFGILYVKERYAREVLDFQDACNQIVGRVVPGRRQQVEVLLERIERMLEPYGVLAATPRRRQASNRFLSDEIGGLKTFSAIMPLIFLFVAALVLNVLMGRLAERQRGVIGTLKALGYSDVQVLGHFLSFGLVVGVAGGLAGIGVGLAIARGMIEMYQEFFQFPSFRFEVYVDLLVEGMAVSVAFATAGTAKGVWRVLRLQPSEAMRPRPPERGGRVFLERFPRIWRPLGFRTHIAIRSLLRNKTRTATGVIASALATAIVLTALASNDSFRFLLDFQFEKVTHGDVQIGMRDAKSIAALYQGRDLPGVDYAEGVLGIVCDLRNGRNSRRLTVTGLAPNHALLTPLQSDLSPIEIPPVGLVMSRKLARILDLRLGDHLELTPVRGRRDTVIVPLAATVEGFLGLECYADQRYLSRVVGEWDAVNAIQMRVNPARTGDLYRTIKRLPNAQGLSVPAQTKANIERTLVETTVVTLWVLLLFAGIIAFGSTMNNSLIEIGDRIREIATFRVLGYKPGQIAGVFFRQSMAVFLLGSVLAWPVGYWMLVGMARTYDTELFRMPIVFRWPTVAVTVLVVLGFVLIAQWFVYRQIRKLDWLEGIQFKE